MYASTPARVQKEMKRGEGEGESDSTSRGEEQTSIPKPVHVHMVKTRIPKQRRPFTHIHVASEPVSLALKLLAVDCEVGGCVGGGGVRVVASRYSPVLSKPVELLFFLFHYFFPDDNNDDSRSASLPPPQPIPGPVFFSPSRNI